MSATNSQHHQHDDSEVTSAGQPGADVVVYGRAGCVQCDATHRALSRADITYRTVNLDDDPDVAQQLSQAGYQQLPVVQAGEQVWTGYRPDEIRALRAS